MEKIFEFKMNVEITKELMKNLWLMLLLLFLARCGNRDKIDQKYPNVLLITLDDMGYGTSGVEGSGVPGITPNIDQLASEGILFKHGFVVSPICGPSRAVMLSGRYPHNNGIMGHGKQPPAGWTPPEVETLRLPAYLKANGYTTGAILKQHQAGPNQWDLVYDEEPYGVGFHDRNPDSFYERTKKFIEGAKQKNIPFFLYANPIDPHRPWANTEQEYELRAEWSIGNPSPGPSRRYAVDEIEVPLFLPDLPGIRTQLAPYYESLHRGDACIGGILRALRESGLEENTLVIFLSDHGMGAIGAKSTLYYAGTRVPVIVKWPGKILAGVVDEETIISSVDLFPTIIDAVGLPQIYGLDGKSFYESLVDSLQVFDRQYAYAASNYFDTSGDSSFFPARSIVDGDYLYVWNSYLAGLREKKTFMYPANWIDVVRTDLDKRNNELTKKIKMIIHQDVEELYDIKKDPGCWNNLVNDPYYRSVIENYRTRLINEMRRTDDPELSKYKYRG